MTTNNDDYKVGYKKPPRHTRFKSGQSGNPRGRKKGSINLPEALRKELNKKIKIREGDEELVVKKIEAFAKSLVNAALKSNRYATADVLKLIDRHFYIVTDGPVSTNDLLEEDKHILELFASRKEKSHDQE